MFELLSKYLRRIGVDYTSHDIDKALDFTVDSPEGKWNCLLSVHPPLGLGFYSTVMTPVPKEKRTQMAIFLTWLNNSRLFGNFEMDLQTGDVRFKTYLDCECSELTERAIDRTMLINVTTMQKYLPQILQVIDNQHAVVNQQVLEMR